MVSYTTTAMYYSMYHECSLEASSIHTGYMSVYPLYSTMHQNTPSVPTVPVPTPTPLSNSTFGSVGSEFLLTTRFAEPAVGKDSPRISPPGSIHLALVAPVPPLHCRPKDAVSWEEGNWEYGGRVAPVLDSTISAPGLMLSVKIIYLYNNACISQKTIYAKIQWYMLYHIVYLRY